MSLPVPHVQNSAVAEFFARHDTLRHIMEWIGDRLADEPDADDSIAWEDGEERDESQGPTAL